MLLRLLTRDKAAKTDKRRKKSFKKVICELQSRVKLKANQNMSDELQHEVTQILNEWSDGDADAPARLMPFVYDELRRRARSYLARERISHTLQPTALVHEAYLRLVDQTRVNWQNRAHFFGLAANMMRRILVDHARARATGKRGGED